MVKDKHHERHATTGARARFPDASSGLRLLIAHVATTHDAAAVDRADEAADMHATPARWRDFRR